MKIRNLILLAFGLLPFLAASQTATFDRVRVRQGLNIRAEKADSIIRAVTALSNHTSIPTAKAVWDAIAAIVAASKYQTLRDDGSNMTQQPAANFVSTGTVAFTLTNDAGNTETEVSAAVPAGGITATEILDGTIANADVSSSANIANSKLANSGVTAGTYPSTGGVIPLLTINSKGIITGVSESANVDASATNEGRLGVGAGGSNDALLTSNTSGATGVTYAGGTAIGISETTNTNGGTITITNTGDTDGTNDLTLSDTTRRVLSSSTHFKYPTAAAVYNAIIAGGTARPDSTWAKSPSGVYTGKRISDNVYRSGKTGIGTTDTTAMLNIKPKNPVGSGHTIAAYIIPPNRSAFSDAAFANFSILEASRIDLNPMRPAHYSGFLYGRWTDTYTIDSTTNLWAGRPGNSIRNAGFNLDGENPSLAKYRHSREQHYLPPGSNAALWEDHLEIVDTLGRNTRVYQFSGQHNGDSYGVGFAANDFHIDKPHNSGYLLRIRGDGSNTGKWSTDYPYTFQINNTTRIGPIMERLYKSAYRNVLDWTTNGRLDVGDSSGVQVTNRLQIIRANATQPEIISPEGYIVFDSTRLEVNSTDANNRQVVLKRPGTSHTWGLNYSASAFAFEADYARTPFSIARTAVSGAFTINATGRVGLGISDAYSLIHAQQPANDLTGGLILAPTTGNYFGLFVNGSNEVAFNRGGTDRMFLTDAGQLKLPAYTSTSSFPITAAGVLGFNSAGQIGTVAGITGTGSGTAGQVAVFDGSSSVTGYTSFTRSGSNIIVGPSGSDHVEIIPGTSEISFFDAGNVDARLKANGTVLETNVGMSITGNSTITGTLDVSGVISAGGHFRAPGISSGNSGIGTTPTGTFNAFAPNGTSPYITFSEAGVANRGAFGFPASSGDFLWSVGNQVLSSGTEKMRLGSTGLKVTGTSSAAQLLLNNTTASTGKNWYINSGNAGSLFIGNPTTADAITINGTTGATTIANTLTVTTATGTATTITGRTSAGVITDVPLSGLTLSGGTLTATGSTPGGSTGQVQYNNAGAFDGSTGLTFDGSENPNFTQAVAFSGDMAVTLNIAGSPYHDYAPGGAYATSSSLIVTTSDDVLLSGLTGGADGRIITLHKVGGNTLTISNEGAGSTAANRFAIGSDIALEADESATFQYTSTSSRWRCIGTGLLQSGQLVYTYSAAGTYDITVPTRVKSVSAVIVGAGGGGGSGRKGTSGVVRSGGSGGGAGAVSIGEWSMLSLGNPTTIRVVVGAAGTAGASQTTNSTNGNPGGTGGNTTIEISGNAFCRAVGGTNGGGGTAAAVTGGTASSVGMFFGSAGGGSSGTGAAGTASAATSNSTPSGGGGGGGITTGNAASAGGGVGATYFQLYNAITGGAIGTTGTNGTAVVAGRWTGTGGPGGGSSTSGNAGAGGNGSIGGGGGGGGSSADGVGNSGAGGAGGVGYAQIIFTF